MEMVVDNLACQRGGRVTLRGVSFRLLPGRALVLRGPNGIGKTTLLRCLAGLAPPVEGSVTPGQEAIAYASHADGIKATLSVAENLTFWAGLYGSDSITSAIDTFNLATLTERPAGMLSAGQKRRLGLARLLVTGRPIWLLDEPTVSLDAASVALFAGAVRDHLQQGGSAVIATHIDLGLDEADILQLDPYQADPDDDPEHAFDEVFL